jgi:hypothetical protein
MGAQRLEQGRRSDQGGQYAEDEAWMQHEHRLRAEAVAAAVDGQDGWYEGDGGEDHGWGEGDEDIENDDGIDDAEEEAYGQDEN